MTQVSTNDAERISIISSVIKLMKHFLGVSFTMNACSSVDSTGESPHDVKSLGKYLTMCQMLIARFYQVTSGSPCLIYPLSPG